MYCAVTGSSNTVSVPSVTVTESLVQVTVVAGPPVEIQVRVNSLFAESSSSVISDIVRSPTCIYNVDKDDSHIQVDVHLISASSHIITRASIFKDKDL